MGITLMHYLHAKSSTVEDVSPGVDDSSLGLDDGLVEVEAVQVEGHG